MTDNHQMASMSDTDILAAHQFPTPLGTMLLIAAEEGLCLLEFVGSQRITREQRDLERLTGRRTVFAENRHTRQTVIEIGEYFQGIRRRFDLELFTPGSPFQQQVWRALQDIPYGETRSYQQQAEYLHHPSAIRAVAAANGANRVSIVIPCHRVIGKNGNLTGYAGGLQRKQWLLEHEQGRQLHKHADLFDFDTPAS